MRTTLSARVNQRLFCDTTVLTVGEVKTHKNLITHNTIIISEGTTPLEAAFCHPGISLTNVTSPLKPSCVSPNTQP